MSKKLILPSGLRQGDRSALAQRSEQWDKHQIRSFALVTVSPDNHINMDFDIHDLTFQEINALGAGVRGIYEHLQMLAAQRAPAHGNA